MQPTTSQPEQIQSQIPSPDQAVTAASENGLPSPTELPGSIVVIYDGKCKFCTKGVTRLNRWDGGKRLSFVSLHHPYVATNYPELTPDMLLEQMYVVTPAGKYLGGAAAFRFMTRKVSRLWILMPVLHIPFTLPLWQWCYMQIAKRRYQLDKEQGNGCDDDACEIHFGEKK